LLINANLNCLKGKGKASSLDTYNP